MSKLILRFKAPMMSFGSETIGNYRPTELAPTKSAIIGLIAGGLGYDYGDSRIDDLSNALQMTSKFINHRQSLGRMRDFQIVHYVNPTKSTGKFEPGGKLVDKFYLTDGAFEVTLTGKRQLLKKCEDAIKHPYYTPYLGRRCCPIAGVIQTELI